MMKNRGVKSLIFTGIATEMGVELSARDAAARGFYPVIATDCVSSMNKDKTRKRPRFLVIELSPQGLADNRKQAADQSVVGLRSRTTRTGRHAYLGLPLAAVAATELR